MMDPMTAAVLLEFEERAERERAELCEFMEAFAKLFEDKEKE